MTDALKQAVALVAVVGIRKAASQAFGWGPEIKLDALQSRLNACLDVLPRDVLESAQPETLSEASRPNTPTSDDRLSLLDRLTTLQRDTPVRAAPRAIELQG
jgi:hypothetical protein